MVFILWQNKNVALIYSIFITTLLRGTVIIPFYRLENSGTWSHTTKMQHSQELMHIIAAQWRPVIHIGGIKQEWPDSTVSLKSSISCLPFISLTFCPWAGHSAALRAFSGTAPKTASSLAVLSKQEPLQKVWSHLTLLGWALNLCPRNYRKRKKRGERERGRRREGR